MVNSPSEARPNRGTPDASATVPAESLAARWTQASLLPHAVIVVEPKLVVDGPSGDLTVSVRVREFWSNDQIALEVRPGLRFPQDLELALDWITALIRSWSAAVSPF